ncbi:MAG: SPFH domain-containing protein [Cyclobacteriaceae bacterium]|nr:SPFH domain-containing protein [Cyclobacteriaceae bacterium]
MGWFSSELIDIIEWLDNSNDTITYRFKRHDNEIKNGAQLVVRESQTAVFVENGEFADVFSPGKYELSTDNLPILSTLKGWKYGFDSPFKAEVYFVNTKLFTNKLWGTPAPIMKRDPEFGVIQIRAFGSYTFRVTDPKLFVKEISGTNDDFSVDQIEEQLSNFIIPDFTDILAESKVPTIDLLTQIKELSKEVADSLENTFEKIGLSIQNFLISSINLPDEIQEAINKRASISSLGNMNTFQQYQSGVAMEDMANNPSGGSEGLSMGMGFGMANQMMNQASKQQQSGDGASTPPPISVESSYHVAVNGQQIGPFGLSILKKMITENQFTKESLVWKEGMTSWDKASTVGELNKLFGKIPPPLPV